jgi:hypothetical protein
LIITKSPDFFPFARASAVDLKEMSDTEFVPDIAGAFVVDMLGEFV